MGCFSHVVFFFSVATYLWASREREASAYVDALIKTERWNQTQGVGYLIRKEFKDSKVQARKPGDEEPRKGSSRVSGGWFGRSSSGSFVHGCTGSGKGKKK